MPLPQEEEDDTDEDDLKGVPAPNGEGSSTCQGRAGDLKGEDYRPMGPITEERAAELQADFVEAMRVRFLNGADKGAFDYAGVDSDDGLDEDWAAVQNRDAEELYFDVD